MPTLYPVLRLQPDRDGHVRNRHHAIFQSAVAVVPVVEDGGIVEVQSSRGDFLCYATFNAKAFICARAICFERGDPLAHLEKQLERAVRMRDRLFESEDTDACRLVNAEGDGLPGLIVDRYGSVVVIQLTTMGMDKLRDWIADRLWKFCEPKAIFEKSTSAARGKEGLEPVEGWVRGQAQPTLTVTERGLKYLIRLEGSQKTGLFLDQREMRQLVHTYAEGRTVLDICSYVGGFSLNALAGGALAADAVDYDREAVATARELVRINGLNADALGTYSEDAFNFLRRTPAPRKYDFIILDPPAFAKRSTDLEPAKKAYTDLNRMALAMLPAGGLLLTCSCSYQMNPELFQNIVTNAARTARRSVKLIQRHRQATDHPVNLFHPEGDYLKSLLLWVD